MATMLVFTSAEKASRVGLCARPMVSLPVATDTLSTSWCGATCQTAAMRRRKASGSKSPNGLPGTRFTRASAQKPTVERSDSPGARGGYNGGGGASGSGGGGGEHEMTLTGPRIELLTEQHRSVGMLSLVIE